MTSNSINYGAPFSSVSDARALFGGTKKKVIITGTAPPPISTKIRRKKSSNAKKPPPPGSKSPSSTPTSTKINYEKYMGRKKSQSTDNLSSTNIPPHYKPNTPSSANGSPRFVDGTMSLEMSQTSPSAQLFSFPKYTQVSIYIYICMQN